MGSRSGSGWLRRKHPQSMVSPTTKVVSFDPREHHPMGFEPHGSDSGSTAYGKWRG